MTGGVLLPVLIALVPTTILAFVYFILPVMAPSMMTALGRPAEDFGWLAGAIGLGSVWFYTSSHAITPVLGPLRTLRLGMLVSIIGIGLVISGLWPLVLFGGFLIGLGYATTTPTSSQVLADFTPRSNWSTYFSLRQAGVPAGGMLAGYLAVLILASYQWPVALFAAVVAVAFSGLLLFAVPARYNQSRPLQPFSLSRLITPVNMIEPARTVGAIRGLGLLVTAGCGFALVHGAVTIFFVTYLVVGLGISNAQAASLFIVLQATAILGRLAGGAIADRNGSALPLLSLLAPMSATSAFLLAILGAEWPPHAFIATTVFIGLTVGTWNGLYLSEIARLVPPDKVGSATAAAAVFGFSTYMITPPLVGLLAASVGWRLTFAIISSGAAVAAVALGLLRWHMQRAG